MKVRAFNGSLIHALALEFALAVTHKAFERFGKPFDKLHKAFERFSKPFDKFHKAFERIGCPFGILNYPFCRSIKPFRTAWQTVRRPFDRRSFRPFNGKPLEYVFAWKVTIVKLRTMKKMTFQASTKTCFCFLEFK